MSSIAKVARVDERSRYEISLDGALIGFAEYELSGDTYSFTHTEIDPTVGGQGYGSQLIEAAVNDVRARGGVVVPLCAFVVDWIERHNGVAQ